MADRMCALRLFVRVARTANISRAAPEWCSGGLLAIFFLILGLEIRREMTGVSLASWKSTSTPVVAARSRLVVSMSTWRGDIEPFLQTSALYAD
jgi:Na+/H+ antiporter NhaA